jgi:hypothetical protein
VNAYKKNLAVYYSIGRVSPRRGDTEREYRETFWKPIDSHTRNQENNILQNNRPPTR